VALMIDAITMDCEDMATVRRFWAEALAWREVEGGEDWSWVEPPDGGRPRICVQRVPERKVVKNRVHLDLRLRAGTTFDQERERLEGLGATAIRLHGTGPGNCHWLMTDPEGNEFCLVDTPAA
jgi:predicted enzyme related to lactoylglutathione lyase